MDQRYQPLFIGPLGTTYHPKKKANAIMDFLGNLFTSYDLYDENHE
jgi:hypothetical protein